MGCRSPDAPRNGDVVMQDAGLDALPAEVVVAHLPDWSPFATKQDLTQGLAWLEIRLIRWMMGIFLAVAVSVLVAVLG